MNSREINGNSKKVWNFSAGPATLPNSVLEKAQNELINYRDTGMSVMEMSHRSLAFIQIIQQAEENLRSLMSIPSDYAVLFLQGGATLQFSIVPLNLQVYGKAAYIDSGNFSKKALQEAQKTGIKTEVVASSAEVSYSHVPATDHLDFTQKFKDYDYVHITTNNTVEGTALNQPPKTADDLPLVADMSSNILSQPINVEDYDLIYAGAQKNIGIAGVTVVIIKKDLLKRSKEQENLPNMLSYQTHFEKDSAYNTPSTYAIYMAGLVFEWLKGLGGLEAIEKLNQEKASLLYDYLDHSQVFNPIVSKEYERDRSIMNVTFKMNDKELDTQFVNFAKERGIENIKGHRSVGGMRASIYNAMPLEGVQALIDVMKDFEQENHYED